MKTLQVYHEIKGKVKSLYHTLKLFKYENTTGRTLSLTLIETITLSLYKQTQSIATKKALWKDFNLSCSYKTLVVNMNRCALIAFVILMRILRENRSDSHWLKHTDSTDIPVCLNKNARNHKTMYGLAQWGHSGKGWFYGVKLHITTDLKRNLLSIAFSSGNGDERKLFLKLNKDLKGIFVADAGYTSEKLEKEFYRENERILFAKPRANMKKIITGFQKKLYDTRMLIELNFRSLKMFYGLATSLPRSINGYLGNYIYSILAYALR